MDWETAMRTAYRWSRKYGKRFRVYGKRFHDSAGILPDAWIYDLEPIS